MKISPYFDINGTYLQNSLVLMKEPESIVPTVSISTQDSLDGLCSVVDMTFTATINTGYTEQYRWYNNGTLQLVYTSAVTLNASSFSVYCIVTNTDNDLSGNSNTISRAHLLTSITISGSKPNFYVNGGWNASWYGQTNHGNFDTYLGYGNSATWGNQVSQTGIYAQLNAGDYPSNFCPGGPYASNSIYFN